MPHRRPIALVALLTTLSFACTPQPPPVAVERITYNNWPDAVRLRNGACELVVVPAVSRVMHFGPAGGPNLLWENPKLAGRTFPADPRDWQNVGGEKLWPTQQNLFGKFTGIGFDWPPPWPWDGGPSKAELLPDGVRLTLPHDARFGAHAVREFRLDPVRPLVHVRQWIAKTQGPPVPMCVWTVMQVNDPAFAFLPTPDGTFADMGSFEGNVTAIPGQVSITRHDTKGRKVGIKPTGQNGYAAAVFETPKGRSLLVQSHKLAEGATYPDKGMQAELYASPRNVAHYTELELLGPFRELKPGERLSDDQVWQIQSLPPQTDPVDAARASHERALEVLKR
ncbi:MAG: hypothetical protein ACAI43_27465 [Phycisphaerae bacterium]